MKYAHNYARIFKKRINSWVEPKDSGLPNNMIFWGPPAIFAFCFILLVIFQISGTSSGMNWYFIQGTYDPNLISGVPRTIRSDEWMVQQAWVISQFNQGFPAFNSHFPGGIDMTVFNDIPAWDWSTIFRPHTWGYLFLGLAHGVAWNWWLPALALIIAVYQTSVLFLPRKPITAVSISIIVILTPFVQWWFLPTTLWTISWVFIAINCLYIVVNSQNRITRFIWATIFSYFTVVLGTEVYAPFIIIAAIIFLGFAIALLLTVMQGFNAEKKNLALMPLKIWHKFQPIVVAGLAAIALLAIWVASRYQTISAILGTVYPGDRSVRTGSGLHSDNASLFNLLSSGWTSILKSTDYPSLLGSNPSEASAPWIAGFILIPASIAIISFLPFRRIFTDWYLVSAVVLTIFFLVYLYLPGWDTFSSIFLLNKIPESRSKIAFVIISPLLLIFVIRIIDSKVIRHPYIYAIATACFGIIVFVYSYRTIKTESETWTLVDSSWKILVPATIIGISLVFIAKLQKVGIAFLLISAFLASWGINPIYKGLYDLTESKVGEQVVAINSTKPGVWIGVGGYSPNLILTEVGLPSFSGVQNYPITPIWSALDPNKKFEQSWNRLAHIRFSISSGETQISSSQTDVIEVSIDPCSPNIQKHIRYVLADENLSEKSNCLDLRTVVHEGAITYFVLELDEPKDN